MKRGRMRRKTTEAIVTRICIVFSVLFLTGPPEKPLWFEEQDKNKDEVNNKLLQLSGQKGGPDRFSQTDDNTAYQRSNDVPHSPQNHDDKRGNNKNSSYVRIHIEERGGECAGCTHAGCANSKSHIVNPFQIDPHRQGPLFLLRGRPDGLSQVRVLEEIIEEAREQDRKQKGNDLRKADHHRPDRRRFLQVPDVQGSEVWTPQEKSKIFDEQGDSEGKQKLVVFGSIQDLSDQETLNKNPKNKKNRD